MFSSRWATLLEITFDSSVVPWVQEQLPETFFSEGSCGIGVSEGGKPLAGVVYTNFTFGELGPHSIEMHIAAVSPRWAHRRTLQLFFWFPFSRLRVNRVTAITAKHNERCRSMLERLGFVHEGSMRQAYPSGDDAEMYGMLAPECRWINGRREKEGTEERG